MSVAEYDAIAAAHEFVRKRNREPFDDASVQVKLEVIEGRNAWVVVAFEPPSVGADVWMEAVWHPVRYYVDYETGELFGFATERSTTFFQ